ncbi:hypothetical protein D3C87_278690 [compost metagenome]
MKKVWIIRNGQKSTIHSHENKTELKKVRDQLNAEAGFKIESGLAQKELSQALQAMPFKITKGPDHPRI